MFTGSLLEFLDRTMRVRDPVYDTSPGILKDCQLISVGVSAAIVDFETVAGQGLASTALDV